MQRKSKASVGTVSALYDFRGLLMSRAVPEWIGKTDDAKVPGRVRRRVFDREGGICHLTGVKIDPVRDAWDLDHAVALILGGQHRESNLFPVLREPHRRKSAAEVTIKAKIEATRQKHMGIKRPAQTIKSAPFPKAEKSRGTKTSLPPRQLFAQEMK